MFRLDINALGFWQWIGLLLLVGMLFDGCAEVVRAVHG